MDIFGILDPDPDPHEDLCGSETQSGACYRLSSLSGPYVVPVTDYHLDLVPIWSLLQIIISIRSLLQIIISIWSLLQIIISIWSLYGPCYRLSSLSGPYMIPVTDYHLYLVPIWSACA